MSERWGVKVVITEQLACGHDCDIIYPMGIHTLVLKSGPLTSINPTNAFPDISLLTLSHNTLEISGEYGEVQYIGIAAKDGCFTCAQCGMLLFALTRAEEE